MKSFMLVLLGITAVGVACPVSLAQSYEDCDCEVDGTTCEAPLPSSCDETAECVACSSDEVGYTCNYEDNWDWCDCVVLADTWCEEKIIATCIDHNCRNPVVLDGVRCVDPEKVKDCKN